MRRYSVSLSCRCRLDLSLDCQPCSLLLCRGNGAPMELDDKTKAPIAATEPPPTYDEASHDKTPLSSESPPSYDQLFGVRRMHQQVKEARDTSSNKGTFAVKFCDIVCSSVLCMICLIILAALPVTMIVIGCVYINRCQGQPIIPIWLIVFGCVGVLQTAINIIKRFFKNNNNGDEERNYVYTSWNCFETCLSFFLLIWIILGSYWVFGYYDSWQLCNAAPDASCSCHPVPYWFSYVTLVVIYVTSCIFCFTFCFAFLVIAFAAAAAD